MTSTSKHTFLTTALNPDLLSTPFGIQTKWHVLIGAPSCGKTTLIDLLAERGFRTVPESARAYMEREIAKGRTLEEIHAHGADLQRTILDLQLNAERGINVMEITFLDGAVPGSLAWYRAFGLNPNGILPECFYHRYASVFILDRLPLQLDGLRFEDDTFVNFLDNWITRDFKALGYEIVRVPVLPPEERLAFVLDCLSNQGMI